MTIGPTAITITNMTVTNLTVTGSFSVASARLVGEVIDYCGTSAPSLWLLAYGQAISRATYSVLFGIIGTAFGVGDGVTTFNVPDYRGRVGIGRDDMGGVAAGRITIGGCGITGTTLGAANALTETNSLVTGQLPSHSHNNTLNDPGHLHTIPLTAPISLAAPGSFSGNRTNYANSTTSNTSTATTGMTITNASTGSGSAINNVQPSIVVNKIIYVAV
jgi:microcystin-dependent protein